MGKSLFRPDKRPIVIRKCKKSRSKKSRMKTHSGRSRLYRTANRSREGALLGRMTRQIIIPVLFLRYWKPQLLFSWMLSGEWALPGLPILITSEEGTFPAYFMRWDDPPLEETASPDIEIISDAPEREGSASEPGAPGSEAYSSSHTLVSKFNSLCRIQVKTLLEVSSNPSKSSNFTQKPCSKSVSSLFCMLHNSNSEREPVTPPLPPVVPSDNPVSLHQAVGYLEL